ncbi:protein transport protein SEC31 homolog B [Humulus lupulus]|uniref:protein transport protein SEC31 homolog B n=1 Tax=Humulus lupulus TaxID=3486 RepID=UPI002B405520|nr:protein transport protein SEC31 homolog B [Humulus lupulus]
MACIKGVNRSASVALAPDAPYMAAGTMAGAVDLSFSSTANLEIFKLDFQTDDRDIPVVGESPSSERFNRLSWSKPTDAGSKKFGLGLIAGGLVDGSIDIWNPLSLISSEPSESALVGHLSRHKGPVRGLEFNVIAPNLLASGADDGEICIWDLVNPAEPTQFPPLKGSGSAAQGEISFLSWNSKVQHILASTSYNGTTVVWDLKKQKPVISFSDSVRRRSSVLQWNPDVATQLVVASDEDGSPALRLWDMRNIMSPVKEFVGHTKGVIAMSWCPNDSSYLLTCAKDNRTICWDTVTAEIVCELPASTNWNFDVHWYPKIPGVISASSFDGKIGIYNVEGCSRYGAGDAAFGAAAYLKAPKWYKRPAGVSFGFGGKLVSFKTKSSAVGAPSVSEVFVDTVVTEHSLVSRSSDFEAAIQNGEKSLLRTLCEKKSEESESENERETWGLLKVMFEDDGTARTKLLTHLGFSVPEVAKPDVQDELSNEVNAIGLNDTTEDTVGFEGGKDATIFPTDNGEDFFNNLPSPKAETPLATSGDKFIVDDTVPSTDQVEEESDVVEESVDDPSFDESVQHALVVGDYKGAVAKCVAANKMADALVIAHAGGDSLWESTRDQYLKMSCSPYLKVVSAMVNNDLLSLVNTRPLKFWKETLALLCSFASREQWTMLCDALASKLNAAGNTLAATICYICAGNIDKTVEIWSKSLSTEHEKSYVDRLQDLMEKTIVLALASGQKRFSASLCKLVEKYAEILASQGLLKTAMEYLRLFGSDEVTPELEILRERIALCESEKHVEPSPPVQPVEVSTSHYQPNPVNSYAEHNGQNLASYGYVAPPPPQNTQMFVPNQQIPQVPKDNFPAPPVPIQSGMRTFVPTNPTLLKNVEQYQQHQQHQQSTLGSQLYPGTTNTSYQPAPNPNNAYQSVPPHNTGYQPILPPNPTYQPMPPPNPTYQPVAPPNPTYQPSPPIAPIPAQPKPNMSFGVQPPSPTNTASMQAAAAPPAPPPTVQTAVTSNVPAHLKPAVATLTRLFNETSEILGGPRANPGKKREIEDNSRKIGALFAKLNSADISTNAAEQLVKLCQALDGGDFSTALQIQVLLTASEWDECNFWLAPLKRMIKTRQNVR